MIRPVSSRLADFLRLWPTPASSDEVGCSAVNRNVGGSNPPRGAKSLVMQRVASILKKLCPLAMKCQVHESRLISINVDERKSTSAGVSEVDQINRGQPRSIALNRAQTKHSARNRMLANSHAGRGTRLPCTWKLARPLNIRAFPSTNRVRLPSRPTLGPNNFRFARHPFLIECNRQITTVTSCKQKAARIKPIALMSQHAPCHARFQDCLRRVDQLGDAHKCERSQRVCVSSFVQLTQVPVDYLHAESTRPDNLRHL